jgi:hypothetical protein
MTIFSKTYIHFESFTIAFLTWLIAMEYLCHKWPRICCTCHHSWIITGFVTRFSRLVPLVGKELLTLPQHLSSPPVFSEVSVTWYLVLCVCFVNRCFPFDHFVVCSSSINGFWLSFWYLQTLIEKKNVFKNCSCIYDCATLMKNESWLSVLRFFFFK